MKLKFLILINLVFATIVANGQGTFRNLNFGLCQVPSSTPPGTVPATQALPFWSAYLGTNKLDSVFYNLQPLGAGVNVTSPNSLYAIIPGQYAVSLTTGGPAQAGSSTSIAQTGQFPDWARTLLFVSSWSLPSPYWEVSINGMNIPVTEQSQVSQGLYLFQGDISAFAGQTGELRFSAIIVNGVAPGIAIGEIQFSATPVPESSVVSLLVVGIVFIVFKPRQ